MKLAWIRSDQFSSIQYMPSHTFMFLTFCQGNLGGHGNPKKKEKNSKATEDSQENINRRWYEGRSSTFWINFCIFSVAVYGLLGGILTFYSM
jgi:hypothetical protein